MVKWTKAKVHVYSDSVVCLGRLSEPPEANQRWDGQLTDFQSTTSYQQLHGVDGKPIEFEWNILPELTSLQILQKIQRDLQGWNIESSSCLCSTTLIGQEKDMKRNVFRIPKRSSRRTRRDSRKDIGRITILTGNGILAHHSWYDDSSYQCQRFESWNLERSERKRKHKFHSGCVSNWSGQLGQSPNETEPTLEMLEFEIDLRVEGVPEESQGAKCTRWKQNGDMTT